MAITLKTLIQAAPFPEEQKKALTENIDKLTEDEKYELSNAAWEAISVMYDGRLETGIKQIQEDIIYGRRKTNPNDYQELEAKLTHEFAQKLQAAESQESIDGVKQQLEKYKTQPLPQDKTVSPKP